MEMKEEQPITNCSAEDEVFCGVNEFEGTTNSEGSSIGKFKTTDALLNAYNNLQAEFTRRCQRIKSLEKELESVNSLKSNEYCKNESAKDIELHNLNSIDDEMLNSNDDIIKGEEAQEITKKYDTADNENVPSYQKTNYNEVLARFLYENKDAKKYAKEISEEMIKDSTLTLQNAYDKVLAKRYRAPSELASDKEFINEYILPNAEILKSIIKKYKEQEQELPTILKNSTSTSIAQAYPNEVKTLKEAGELAKKLFS